MSAAFDGAGTALLVAILTLFVISIVLAVAETALTRLSPSRARSIAAKGGFGTKHLSTLVERPEEFLNVILLVVLVCQLVQATLIGLYAERVLGTWGVVTGTIVNVVVVFVVAEAIPKTWAIERTERAARLTSTLVWRLSRFLPLALIARGLIGLTNVIIPGKGLEHGPFVSEEEFLALTQEAVSAEILEVEERVLIEQVIDFGDTICREVMVPRPDMVTVDADTTVAEALGVALAAGRSRVPVCGEGIDDIVGVAYAKDLMRSDRDGRGGDVVVRVARRAHFVPETKRIAELLPEMQARKFHLAVVVDEYGGTAGIVTLEDVLEELVGEIVDEFDHEDPMVVHLPGGAVRVQARMPVDEVNELLHAELPEGDWDSIGGLMFHLLGHVPETGDVTTSAGLVLRAENVVGRRIGTVRIERRPEPEPTEESTP